VEVAVDPTLPAAVADREGVVVVPTRLVRHGSADRTAISKHWKS